MDVAGRCRAIIVADCDDDARAAMLLGVALLDVLYAERLASICVVTYPQHKSSIILLIIPVKEYGHFFKE